MQRVYFVVHYSIYFFSSGASGERRGKYNREIFLEMAASKIQFKSIFWQCHLSFYVVFHYSDDSASKRYGQKLTHPNFEKKAQKRHFTTTRIFIFRLFLQFVELFGRKILFSKNAPHFCYIHTMILKIGV